jgi:hypothetical protein
MQNWGAVMKRKWRIGGGILIFFVALLIAARLYLNVWLLGYVNDILNRINGYEGSVESIDIDLYRGAYRAHHLQLFKKEGRIPVPFIDIKTVDLSVEWSALLHGRIVSDAELDQPVINFAVNKSGTAEQTGAGVDWSKPIKDLMPIDINLVTFKNGKLTYQDFSTKPQVNIYIHHMSGEAQNLRNVVDANEALPSSLLVKGDSIGGGNLEIKGKMNILKPVPDMDLKTKLEHVHLPALSDYSNAYAAVDIKDGNLNVYSEFILKDNRVSGYVKPLATHVSLIDLSKKTNPIKLAWEAVVAVVVEIFTNHPKDQFATKIPLEGNLDNIDTDSWSAVAGIIRNAFIRAFKNGLDNDEGKLDMPLK